MSNIKGGFVINNGHSSNRQKGNYSSPDKDKMIEVLVLYKNVEFIRTSIKRGKNYVDYILCEDKCNTVNERIINHLSKRIQIFKLAEILPDYFVQVNQSEIINVFHIIGRSGKYLFTEKKSIGFRISKNHIDNVNRVLGMFFHN